MLGDTLAGGGHVEVQATIQANLERYRGGIIDGWADLGGDNQAVRIRVDQSVYLHTQASRFREDLAAAGIRSGFAAFSVPVPCFLLDGAEHQLELMPANAEAVEPSTSFTFRFEIPEHIKALERSIISVSGSIKRIKGQRIALLCGYQANGLVSSSTCATIRVLQRAGFKVIYILAADTPPPGDKVLETPAEINILRWNGGYDFGSWAAGYLHLRTKLGRGAPESVLLMNDSLLWTGQSLDAKFIQLSRGGIDFDVLGATESYDRRFHLQSFYMLFSKRVIEQNILDEFLLYQGVMSSNKDDVISRFELSTHQFFAAKGLTIGAAIGYHELITDLWSDLVDYVETHQKAFVPEVLARFGGIHDVLNWMNSIRSGNAINPSHSGWLQIARNGFPFIKKEIVLKNPVRVPFFEQIRSVFQGQALSDLDDFVRSHSGSLVPTSVALIGPAVVPQLRAVVPGNYAPM